MFFSQGTDYPLLVPTFESINLSFFPFGGICDRFEGQSAKPPNGELGEDSDTHTALHIGDYSILANEKTLKNTTRWAPSPVIDWLRTLLQVVFFSPQLPFYFRPSTAITHLQRS